MLPFEIHVKAYEFSSKDEAKAFIQQELLIYKQRLYSDFISGNLNANDLVNILLVK
jgi:hypothetical protein